MSVLTTHKTKKATDKLSTQSYFLNDEYILFPLFTVHNAMKMVYFPILGWTVSYHLLVHNGMIYNMYNTYNSNMFKETIRFSCFILFQKRHAGFPGL